MDAKQRRTNTLLKKGEKGEVVSDGGDPGEGGLTPWTLGGGEMMRERKHNRGTYISRTRCRSSLVCLRPSIFPDGTGRTETACAYEKMWTSEFTFSE